MQLLPPATGKTWITFFLPSMFDSLHRPCSALKEDRFAKLNETWQSPGVLDSLS